MASRSIYVSTEILKLTANVSEPICNPLRASIINYTPSQASSQN